jgi:DegV family protein with EDD domain
VALYERLLERHRSVVSVHIAGAISGTVEAARTAADRVDPGHIHVVDARQVSVGLGLVVEAVGRAIRRGVSLDEALAIAERTSREVRVFGSTPSLEHAVRGGRVDARVAWVLERLGVKPIIDFDEQGKPYKGGVKIGFGRALSALAKRAQHFAAGASASVTVVHADAPTAGEKLAGAVRERLGLPEVPVVQAGAVLGTHVGPGAVALAVRREAG